MEEGGTSAGILPTKNDQEFRPFVRRLPEFKFWYSATKAVAIGFVASWFSVFDVPVFWPVLVVYWILLFVLTSKFLLCFFCLLFWAMHWDGCCGEWVSGSAVAFGDACGKGTGTFGAGGVWAQERNNELRTFVCKSQTLPHSSIRRLTQSPSSLSTVRRQIQHMIKYRYVPFTVGKKSYKGGAN